MLKPKLFFAILIIIQIMSLSCIKSKQFTYEYNDFIFGSYIRIVLMAQDSLQAKQAICKVMQTLHQIDTVASSFNPASEISQLNKNRCALMSPDFRALVTKSIEVSDNSNGAFDITVGSAMKSFYDGFVTDTSAVIDYRKMQIKGDSIFLLPDIMIDLGGLAVGYALDKAVIMLKLAGIKDALIDAGGDIICFGDKVYNIGIKNPKQKGVIKTIQLKNQSISTSGNYEKYVEKGSQKYTHIINPKTAQAIAKTSQGLNSVTIIADKCVDADAYATAVFVMGVEDGQNLIRKLKLEGMLVTNDGKMIDVK